MKRLNCEEICIQKFSCYSAGRGILYWPACWVAYKRKPGRPQSLVCSQWSTPPHPLWTQPELHHLDTVCWISKFPIVNKCHFPWACPDQQGRAHFHQSGKLEHAPFKWARPIQVSAPLSNNQANLSAPHSSECAPFHQSGKFESAPFKWARPFPSIRQTWARPSQKGALFPIHQTVSQELKMNRGMAKPGPTCRNRTRTHTLQ